MITVTIEPDDRRFEAPQANTVLQLLNRMGLRSSRTLVIRDSLLLTPDQRLHHGDAITLRKVGSKG